MVLAHSQFYDHMQSMLDEVHDKTSHDYVSEHAQLPPVDLFQLHFMYLFLHEQGQDEWEIEKTCIPMLFVQTGLDAHEMVTEDGTGDMTDESMKERQLLVLAGDQFSGHYYHYLANKGEVYAIRLWAQIIEKVNECKTDILYSGTHLTKAERLQQELKLKRTIVDALLDEHGAESFWYGIFALFAELGLVYQQFDGHPEQIEQLIKQIKKTLIEKGQPLLIQEMSPWLDHMQNNTLVIEP
ncbi:heptaprenyl diphosphate synthase component 1 [Caldalkalibacillus salinus]|uniref:heptaprenyl diphosphate synthase component 1 n=1 Tax=Caldalkalibacillus salinus TaxID=2803787 RepID=UPI001922CCD9|nr:heptaprenyl diphosphate synthase component 1 [Caldalkalibacillus salinus]